MGEARADLISLALFFADDRRMNSALPRLVGLPLDGAFQLKFYVPKGGIARGDQANG